MFLSFQKLWTDAFVWSLSFSTFWSTFYHNKITVHSKTQNVTFCQKCSFMWSMGCFDVFWKVRYLKVNWDHSLWCKIQDYTWLTVSKCNDISRTYLKAITIWQAYELVLFSRSNGRSKFMAKKWKAMYKFILSHVSNDMSRMLQPLENPVNVVWLFKVKIQGTKGERNKNIAFSLSNIAIIHLELAI